METKYIVNNLSGQTINGDLTINGDFVITGTTNIRPYKVYTALLTQSGGDVKITLTNESLTIGVTYVIDNNEESTADFTNVGAPNNNIDTYFVATGTTPNSWGITNLAELTYNTGAPVATVLENTIGNIWFNYEAEGIYGCQSNNLFTTGKTFILATPTIEANTVSIVVTNGMESVIYISPLNNSLNAFDNGLFNTPIEIRVYN